jgi:hypothetical protein
MRASGSLIVVQKEKPILIENIKQKIHHKQAQSMQILSRNNEVNHHLTTLNMLEGKKHEIMRKKLNENDFGKIKIDV